MLKFYKRPTLALMLLLIMLCLGFWSIQKIELSGTVSNYESVFVIVIEYFGLDAEHIEKLITRPMESELASLEGTDSIDSSTENGKCKLIIHYPDNRGMNNRYLAIRSAVERVYTNFPQAVQRPTIYSSQSDESPFFIFGIKSKKNNFVDKKQLAHFVQDELKPRLLQLDGIGQLELNGISPEEIHVDLDMAKAAQFKITSDTVATSIDDHNLLNVVGLVRTEQRANELIFDSTLANIAKFKDVYIAHDKGPATQLGTVANVVQVTRRAEEIARLDDEEGIVLYAFPAADANIISLSRAIKKVLAEYEVSNGLQFPIIKDSGAELLQNLQSFIAALLEGMILIILVLPFFLRNFVKIIALVLFLCFTTFFTLASMSVLKFSVNQYSILGFIIGLGTIIDLGIIICEQKRIEHLPHLLPKLFAGLLASLIILIPLAALDFVIPGSKAISFTVGLILIFSFLFAAMYLPFAHNVVWKIALPRTKQITQIKNICHHYQQKSLKMFYWVSYTLLQSAKIVLIVSLIVCVIGLASLFVIKKDFAPAPSRDSIAVHLEFPSGINVERSDELTRNLGQQIKQLTGVKIVQSDAKPGAADLAVQFDPTQVTHSQLAQMILPLGKSLAEGSLFLPETSKNERELAVTALGEDATILEKNIQAATEALAKKKYSIVLNFKEAPSALRLVLDHSRATNSHIDVATLAQQINAAVQAPVISKWRSNDHEYDVRTAAAQAQNFSASDIMALTLPSDKDQIMRVADIFKIETYKEHAKIYHHNRETALTFTVRSQNESLEELTESIAATLKTIELPRGYAFELDTSARELTHKFNQLFFMLAISIVLIFIILGIFLESVWRPLLVLAVIPPTLALPLLYLLVTHGSLQSATIAAFIFVLGLSVNNSLLFLDKYDSYTHCKNKMQRLTYTLRSCLSPFMSSSLMASIATLPMLFLPNQNEFVGQFSFTLLLGILGSILAIMIVFPCLIATRKN